MPSSLTQYFRCPERFDRVIWKDASPAAIGYFRFGEGLTCFGSYHAQQPTPVPPEALHDALAEVVIEDGKACLPFNPSQVVDNLHREAYVGEWRAGALWALTQIYYLVRPALPVSVRRHLQMLHLRDWKKITFPSWPVDCSVDNLLEQLLLLSLRAGDNAPIPFIWFWPDAHSSSAIMTHDVETQAGCEFCSTLMDVDEEFGIKSSFQIIPEERYQIRPELLQEIRARGFEICVHDLNHDGYLYSNRERFLERAARINAYRVEMGADGFRAAVLYRKQIWYDSLKFSYDMSVPNVAHLDPQRGGCCTVMPYFLNEILEIPVTTVQDYSLFNILHDYSISLWEQQTKIIMEKHGCMSFIVHPDYVQQPRELSIYKLLLNYLDRLRQERGVWITTPGEVNRWWRQRAALELVETDRGWHIEGEGKERACIAFASEEDGRVVYSLQNPPRSESPVANRTAPAAAQN
jgi:hypothetical protein